MKNLLRYCALHKGILPIPEDCLAPPKHQITPRPRPLRARKITFSSHSNSAIQVMTSLNYILGRWTSHMMCKLAAQTHTDLQTPQWNPTPRQKFLICHQVLSRARTACYHNTNMHPPFISYQQFQRKSRVDTNFHQSLRMTEGQTRNHNGTFASRPKMQLIEVLVRRCHAT